MSRTVRDQGKRDAIAEAVWVVAATSGLGSVSMRSVAQAAGVSPGRVQHYFPTSVELVRASVEHLIAVAERLHTDPDSDSLTRLRMLLTHAIAAEGPGRPGMSVFYAFVAASVGDPQIAAILAEAKRGAADEARALLLALTPGRADAGARADELLALADGLALQVFIGALAPERAMAVVEAALERALASELAGVVPQG